LRAAAANVITVGFAHLLDSPHQGRGTKSQARKQADESPLPQHEFETLGGGLATIQKDEEQEPFCAATDDLKLTSNWPREGGGCLQQMASAWPTGNI
jgi:hypothetical protein